MHTIKVEIPSVVVICFCLIMAVVMTAVGVWLGIMGHYSTATIVLLGASLCGAVGHMLHCIAEGNP
jgi:hypothetical protein